MVALWRLLQRDHAKRLQFRRPPLKTIKAVLCGRFATQSLVSARKGTATLLHRGHSQPLSFCDRCTPGLLESHHASVERRIVLGEKRSSRRQIGCALRSGILPTFCTCFGMHILCCPRLLGLNTQLPLLVSYSLCRR